MHASKRPIKPLAYLALVAWTCLALGCSDNGDKDGTDETSAADAGGVTDAAIADGKGEVDGGPTGEDVGSGVDGATTSDAGATDSGPVVDSSAASDSGPVADSGATSDSSTVADSGAASDSSTVADSGAPSDSSTVADSGASDSGAGSDSSAGADAIASSDAAAGPDAGFKGGVLPEQKGSWLSKPIRLTDGALWNPIRSISDGKGGTLKLQNLPPLIKPEKTRYELGIHRPGALMIMVRDGHGIGAPHGRFVSSTGAKLTALDAIDKAHGHVMGPVAPMFGSDPKTLAAQRLKLERKNGKALRGLETFFIRIVHDGADLAAIADAYNDSPLIELASPMSAGASEDMPAHVGESTAGDLGLTTHDATMFQTYLHGSQTAANSAGGFGVNYAWSIAGGRGEGTQLGHLERTWNRLHEDVDWNQTTLQSTWNGGTSQDYRNSGHEMGCLGVMKARNDALGITGICSESHVHLTPIDDVDQVSTWAGSFAAWWHGDNRHWVFAQSMLRLGSVLPAGSFVTMSVPADGPNTRPCGAQTATPSRRCAPRVQCLPPSPWVTDGGVTRMRCEGWPHLDLATNGCTTDAHCQKWGFGARCLPVSMAIPSPFGLIERKWRCGGDPSASECTTSADCELVADCVSGRCGGFTRPAWMGPATLWVTPNTRAAGGACALAANCPIPANTPRCDSEGTCNRNWVAMEYDPIAHAAVSWAAARDVTLLSSASNYRQRLGLLTDESVPFAGGGALRGHDLYKRFYACPFPGCQGHSGGVVVGATAGEAGSVAGFSNRGPRVKVAGWGGDVASLGPSRSTNTPIHTEAAPVAGRQTNNYRGDFGGTSSATPLVAALATSLQGIVKAATGAPTTGKTIIQALIKGGVAINANFHNNIGPRPLMQGAIKWLTTNPKVGDKAGKPVLPTKLASLGPPALIVTELAATARDINPTTKGITVAFTIKNAGPQTSPPVGLRISYGPKGFAAPGPPPPAGAPKVADPGSSETIGWTCADYANPALCCTAGAHIKCRATDQDSKWIFAPMVDGTEASPGGGTRSVFYEFQVAKTQYDGMGAHPQVCVMLDRYGNNTTGSWLNPGGQAPNLSNCQPIGDVVDTIAISSTFGGKQQLRPYSFAVNPDATLCGEKLLANDGKTSMFDVAAVTRRQFLLLSAYPHSGTVGVFDAATCKEMDFDRSNDTPSCGAANKINRLDFTGQTPGIPSACHGPELVKKQGRNPMAIAVSRDQRFAAVALANVKDKCKPGKLAIIDLRTPNKPKILREDVGGVMKNIEVPIGPNPVAIAISHEGQTDARIVVIHDTNSTLCKKAPHASVINLDHVIDNGSKAKVVTRNFLYKCSGGFCAPRLPQRVVIDANNLAAFVTFKQDGTGSINIKNTGSIGMLRLKDLHTNVFFRKPNPDDKSFDRPYGIDAVNLKDSKVRVVFVAESFLGLKQDYSGNKCGFGKTCSGLHWHDIDVATSKGFHVNAGRLMPNVTAARDVVISHDGKHLLVGTNNTKVARYTIGAWVNIKQDAAVTLQGGKRIIALPKADDFCPDERCNDLDDDCDGDTDEDWSKKGAPCEVGVGICLRKGKLACHTDKMTLRCDKQPGPSAVEKCNGLDDDCDGGTDDPWTYDLGNPCSAGKGVCVRWGKKICDGTTSVCSAKAATGGTETCNGLDDDCDGQTDEGQTCPKPDPCKGVSCGKGTCHHSNGVPFCICDPGHRAMGLRCVANLTCNITLPRRGPCPLACTGGCMGPTCIIRCAGVNACDAKTIACPKDRSCRVDCIGDGACKDAKISCGDGLLCETRCQGAGACKDAEITCGKGLCQVACWAGGGKLKAMSCGSACGCLKGCL